MPTRAFTTSMPRNVKIDLTGVPQIPNEYTEIMDRPRNNRLNREQRRHCDKIIEAAKREINRRVLRAMKNAT